MKGNLNTNNLTYTKNDIIFNYSRQEFPLHLIEKNIINVSDFIFEKDFQDPESNTKKPKFGNCFLVEDELEPRKNFKGKKPYQNQFNKNYNQNMNVSNNDSSWRRTEPDDPGFFDDFKGKSDAKQVIAFKRNLELSEMKEINIMFSNCVLFDFKEREEKEFFEAQKRKNGKGLFLNKIFFFKFF